jgi:ribosomal protein L33
MVRKTVSALLRQIGFYLFFLLVSCGSEDEPVNPVDPNNRNNPGNPVVETPPGAQSCLLKSVEDGSMSYVISRNEKGLPTKLTYVKFNGKPIERTCTFEYDDADRMIRLGHETISFTYKYDNSNRIISEKFKTQSNSPVPYLYDTERIFTYNDEGYLDSAYYSSEVYERYVYDDNGNMIKKFVKYHAQPEFLAQEFLAFDDKKNPFYEFSFTHQFLSNLSGLDAVATNFNPVSHKTNLLQSKVYAADGTVTSYATEFNYNDVGYPISIPGSGLPVFQYQCK